MPYGIKTVLVVDDEPSDLELLARTLAGLEYHVITATDGKAALEAFHKAGAIDLLITDVAMSPMDGSELALLLTDLDPELPVIFASGYVGEQALQYKRLPASRSTFLKKPFNEDELRAKVRAVLEAEAPVEDASISASRAY